MRSLIIWQWKKFIICYKFLLLLDRVFSELLGKNLNPPSFQKVMNLVWSFSLFTRYRCWQARNQLGIPGGTKNILRGAQIFWRVSNNFKLCPAHFSKGGLAPLVTGLDAGGDPVKAKHLHIAVAVGSPLKAKCLYVTADFGPLRKQGTYTLR